MWTKCKGYGIIARGLLMVSYHHKSVKENLCVASAILLTHPVLLELTWSLAIVRNLYEHAPYAKYATN